ncbi:MAG: 1-acyl-sn-glycerol-3-phosphate acyltransferase [Alphaproteobacteria bacterium]
MKKLWNKLRGFAEDGTLRAALKTPLAAAVVVGALCAIPFQIAYGMTGRRSQKVRDFFMNRAADLTSIKVEFNEKSAPLMEHNAIFGIKHVARADAFVVPHMPNSDFMMTDHFFKTPVVGPILKIAAESAGFIPTSQTQDNKKRDLGIVIGRLNRGINPSLFPEGTCPGAEMLEWSKGTLEPLFGEAGIDKNGKEVFLDNPDTVAFQPIALRVKSIDGEDVLHAPEKWGKYSMILDKRPIVPSRIFDRMKAKEIVLDLYPLEPLYAKNFNSAADMANEAHKRVREIVNPNQSETRRRKEFLEWRDGAPHQTYW